MIKVRTKVTVDVMCFDLSILVVLYVDVRRYLSKY